MSGHRLAPFLALHRATVCRRLLRTTVHVRAPCQCPSLSCVRTQSNGLLAAVGHNADVDQDYWHGRIWAPMIQLTYWGLAQYSSAEARGAAAGLVAQSRALLLRNWLPEPHFTGNGSAAGMGSCAPNLSDSHSRVKAAVECPQSLASLHKRSEMESHLRPFCVAQVRLRKLRSGRRRRLFVDQLRVSAL